MAKNNAPETVRLNKFIAEAGIASRRHADRIIEEGRVTINGKKVYELGIKVNPYEDNVFIDGKPVKKPTYKIYLAFHKPKGVITTMSDPEGRPCVAEYLDTVPVRVFPIGRLDWESEGLLLLTNDGDFANQVMHPKTEVTKTYHVKVDGKPTQEQLDKLIRGISIIGGKVAAKHIERIKPAKSASTQYNWYKVVISEGKNHQVRQMFAKIGYDVMKLQRVAIGKFMLGNLDRGELVYINEAHLDKIFEPDLPFDATANKNKTKRTISSKRNPDKAELKNRKKLFR